MADILVMEIEPPKYGELCIVLDKDGKVYEDDGHFRTEIGGWKKLPSHGRLVDGDKLLADHNLNENLDYMVLECIIRNAPTVVERTT